jgi:replicative DNA helicase
MNANVTPLPEREPGDFTRTDPHDIRAEQAVLGAMLLSAAAVEACLAALAREDFYRPAHGTIFACIAAMARDSEPVDAITVKDRLEAQGEISLTGGAPYLHTLLASVPVVANCREYAGIVRDHAVRRRLLLAGRRILQWADGSGCEDGPHGITERALREVEAVRDSGQGDGITAQTISEFLAAEESDDYDWIVPDLLERGDRLVITGAEGAGKSSLLRQFGVCIAAGVHPFTNKPIDPKRVLIVDCENSARHMRRKLRPLRIQAELQGHPINDANLWIEAKPGGIDLARDRDVSWLLRQVTMIRPDVVITGPLYKLAPRALNSDDDAAPVLAVLDMIRARDACLILEAHAGHGIGPGGRRDWRPRGSAALMGWPEFGYGLRWSDDETSKDERTVDLVSWRGDRDERNWPEMLTAGGIWPWRVHTPLPVKGGAYSGWGDE